MRSHQDGLPKLLSGKESACEAADMVQSLSKEDPLEKYMATHSNSLAMARGVWWATVHRAAKSQTQLRN